MKCIVCRERDVDREQWCWYCLMWIAGEPKQ